MDAKSTASNAMGGYFIRQSVRQECAADTSATSCAPVRHSIVPREMFLPPMLGDVAPGAKPHSVAPACIFEKLDQPSRPGGTPDETIMKIDRHHLGVFGAFLVEQVETVHHVTRESVRGAESRIAVEAVVVGLEGARNHEVVSPAELDPERKLVTQIVAVVQEAAVLDQQPTRVVARPTVEPAERRLAGELRDSLDGEADMIALGFLVDLEIIEPTITVADDLVSLSDKGLGQLRTLLERAHDSQDADLDAESLEDTHEPPAPAARPIFERQFHRRAAGPLIARQADITERVFGPVVALEQAMLAARFDVEVDVDRDAGGPGPFRIGRLWTVAVEISRRSGIELRAEKWWRWRWNRPDRARSW